MYTEASRPRRVRDVARLLTPVFTASAGQCLTFWFHMYGRTMGTLNIYAAPNATNPAFGSPIWSLSGNQGNLWQQEYVPIPNLSAEIVSQTIKNNVFKSNH